MTRTKRFLPVIHISDLNQTIRNVEIANEAGADGIFLINHDSLNPWQISTVATRIHKEFPDLWIGWNRLGRSTASAFNDLPDFLKAVWTDNAHIHASKDGELSLGVAERIAKIRSDLGFKGLYFGGFAFKYTQQPKDLEQAAQHARNHIDVITTSGPGTGHAADVDKISRIRGAIGDHPLAIASGITPENVGEFLPYVDYFLVATGISDSFHELNADKTRALRDRIKS